MDKLAITSLMPVKVNILNTKEYDHIQLNIIFSRNTKKKGVENESGLFYGDYQIKIVRTDESDEDRTFLIEYMIHVEFSCNNPNATPEILNESIIREVYPHLRSGISCIMGAAGIQPILLPPVPPALNK